MSRPYTCGPIPSPSSHFPLAFVLFKIVNQVRLSMHSVTGSHAPTKSTFMSGSARHNLIGRGASAGTMASTG